jgi:hypothetical protein
MALLPGGAVPVSPAGHALAQPASPAHTLALPATAPSISRRFSTACIPVAFWRYVDY